MPTAKIYCLVDPRTNAIRYVGKTIQSIEARITAHMADRSNCHKVHWLNQLRAIEARPYGVVLSEIEGEWPWQTEEIYWIAKLKSMGAHLTNNTIGGDGVSGVTGASRERMLATWKGRRHTQETIEKLKVVRSRRITSDETRAKMSRSQKGRKITWGNAISDSVRKLSLQDAEIIQGRISDGETVAAIAAELGMHRTSISKVKAGTYFERAAKRRN